MCKKMTMVERMYLGNATNHNTPRSFDYPMTYGSLDAYGWPGGDSVYYTDSACNILCPKCAQAIFEARRADDLLVALGAEKGWDEFDEDGICLGPDPVLGYMRDSIGWESTRDMPTHYATHDEGAPLACEECNSDIESSYGPADDDD